jgi:hypothetical protein
VKKKFSVSCASGAKDHWQALYPGAPPAIKPPAVHADKETKRSPLKRKIVDLTLKIIIYFIRYY